MDTVGKRLRSERMRLGLSQPEFAAIGGLKHKTQLNYEADVSSPDARYLLALRSVGVDVWFVLTGEHSGAALAADESETLDGYRMLNAPSKAAVRSLIQTCVEASASNAGGEAAVPRERRVRRLASNRIAALDEKAAKTVQRAMQAVGEHRVRRSGPKPAKSPCDDTKQG